jgi:hypothetical protein
MSVICPAGHESATSDYCDECGRPIDVSPAAPEPVSEPPPAPLEDEDTSPATRREPCPRCGTRRSGDDLFCEGCGYDFTTPPESPEPEASWELVASADPEQFQRFRMDGIEFPTSFEPRHFALTGPVLRIGRSRDADTVKAEIDLAGSPEDPAISRLHAELARQGDGTYSIRDLGSTNGTMLNDNSNPLEPDLAVSLAPGDRIRIGAWTTITVVER